MASQGLDYIITLRLPRHSIKKLDALAKASYRGRAGVVRALIDLAEPSSVSDLMLRAGLVEPHAALKAPEMADVPA
jgi:hypothetical protein